MENIFHKNYFRTGAYEREQGISSGYSMIELLVVVVLIVFIGYITTNIFILNFRAHAKSEILKEVKQNGDYIISVIEDTIRGSSDIADICGAPSSNTVTVYTSGSETATFACRANGGNFDMEKTTDNGTDPPVVEILESNSVVLSACSIMFVCPVDETAPKYVNVSFTIEQAPVAGVTDLPVEKKASLYYQSTVSLRNYR